MDRIKYLRKKRKIVIAKVPNGGTKIYFETFFPLVTKILSRCLKLNFEYHLRTPMGLGEFSSYISDEEIAELLAPYPILMAKYKEIREERFFIVEISFKERTAKFPPDIINF